MCSLLPYAWAKPKLFRRNVHARHQSARGHAASRLRSGCHTQRFNHFRAISSIDGGEGGRLLDKKHELYFSSYF